MKSSGLSALIHRRPLMRRRTSPRNCATRLLRLGVDRLEPRRVLTSFISGPWGWVGAFGALASDTASDFEGNVYVVGSVSGYDYRAPLDYDPGPGEYSIRPSNGSDPKYRDAFLAKFSADGTFQWVHVASAPWSAVGFINVEVASDGTVRMTGYATNHHAWSETSVQGITLRPGQSASFASKYTPDGSIEWTSVIPSTCSVVQAQAAIEPTTNAFLLGSDSQNLYRVSSDGVIVATPLPFTRLSDLGGTQGVVRVERYAADREGNIILAGTLRGGADFDPSSDIGDMYGTFQWGWNSGYTQWIRQWSDDVFVAKYSASGTLQFVSLQGLATAHETLNSFAIGVDGSIATATSTYYLSSTREVASYSPTGDKRWSKQVEFDTSMRGLIGLTHKAEGQVVLVTHNGFVDINPLGSPMLSWRNRIVDGNLSGGYLDEFNRAIVWSAGNSGMMGWPSPTMESSGPFPIVAGNVNSGAYYGFPGTYFGTILEPALPLPPTSLRATLGDQKVSLAWVSPVYSGGINITDYVVESSADGGRTWVRFDDGVSTSTSATITGLLNGTTYIFRVAATNGVGSGPYSLASAPVTPTQELVINLASGVSTVDSQARVGATQIIKRGLGALILDKPNSHFGGTVVEAGEVIVRNMSALGTGTLEIRAGAKLTLDIGSVNWNGGTNAIQLPGLQIDPNGRLEVGTGQIRVAAGGYDAASIRSALVAGRSGGDWQGGVSGVGITSEFAMDGIQRAIGYRIVASTNELRLGFAAFGDTNLDGKVSSTDVTLINNARRFGQAASPSTGWADGDFNYDGRVTSTDITMFNNTQLFGKGSYLPVAPSSQSVTTTVPGTISADLWAAYAVATESKTVPKKR